MEAHETADQIREAVAEERAERRVAERFRTRAAIGIAVLAMLLAIASLGGENARKEMTNSNILASDTWAFYQAKSIRQTEYRLAADNLEELLPTLPSDRQATAKKKIDDYRAAVARYESEPDSKEPNDPLKGEGKRELAARARALEAQRDHAKAQDPNFDYASALFQIAIVLGSVAIVATSRLIRAFSLGLGLVATVLMLNGFFLLFALPIGG